MQRVPKAGHSSGFFALQYEAADAFGRPVRHAVLHHARTCSGVEAEIGVTRARGRSARFPRCRAICAGRRGTPRGSIPAPGGCPRGGPRGCIGSRPRAAARSSCRTHIRTPCRMSSGSKPVTTIGTRYLRRAAHIPRSPSRRRHGRRRESPGRGWSARRAARSHRRRHQHVRDQHREIPTPWLAR